MVERFFREAKAVCAIGHKAIIDIENFGRLPDGEPFYLMEFFPGESLMDRARRKPLRLKRRESSMPLARTPDTDAVERLGKIAAGPDALRVMGKEIYLFCPDGYGRSKLTNTVVANANFTNTVSHVKATYQYSLSKRTVVYTSLAQLSNGDRSTLAVARGTSITAPTALGGKSKGFELGVRHFF